MWLGKHNIQGIVLDPQDPRHIYLAREISGKFEIEHRQLLPDGQWTTSLITAHSSANNVRPYMVYNAPPKYALLLWMSGVYRHYTEYETDLKIAKLPY